MKFAITSIIFMLFIITCSYAENLNIILNNGSVVQGSLLGVTPTTVYLEITNSQAVTVNRASIQTIFDQDTGDQVVLGSNSVSNTAPAPAPDISVTTNYNAPDNNTGNPQASPDVNPDVNPNVSPDVNTAVSVTVNAAADPDIIVIPQTYVYYYRYLNYDCFYFQGFWWRTFNGVWFRSGIYNSGWTVISPAYVPYNVSHLPRNWRLTVANGPRIGWSETKVYWNLWQKNNYWSNNNWKGGSYRGRYTPPAGYNVKTIDTGNQRIVNSYMDTNNQYNGRDDKDKNRR